MKKIIILFFVFLFGLFNYWFSYWESDDVDSDFTEIYNQAEKNVSEAIKRADQAYEDLINAQENTYEAKKENYDSRLQEFSELENKVQDYLDSARNENSQNDDLSVSSIPEILTDSQKEELQNLIDARDASNEELIKAREEMEIAEEEKSDRQEAVSNAEANLDSANSDVSSSKEDFSKKRNEFCKESKWCIDQPSFEINVWSLTPWSLWMEWETIEERANWVLGTIIQRMMIALWVLSVLIMTIWAWYIILNNWQDELLSKWKSIFMAWIYSILISLASYYLVAIVRYMLFA